MIVFLPFTFKVSFFFFPPEVSEGGGEQGTTHQPAVRVADQDLPVRLARMRSCADFNGLWKTLYLSSSLDEICFNVTLFPREYVCALQRLYLAPLLANPSDRKLFMKLGLGAPFSPLETALSRMFSRQVCRGLHCCSLFMLRNKLDLTICSCFWHLSLVQKFPLWSVKK